MNYPKPLELWNKSPNDFNKWRRDNDLKKLFECFKKSLPHFDEWLSDNKLTVDFILETDNPGQFFYWKNFTYCVKTTEENDVSYFFVPVYNDRHDKRLQKIEYQRQENQTTESFKFKPYFVWVKDKYKLDKPIKTKYSGDLETFRYTSGSAPGDPDLCSWSIAPGIHVLKLGGVKINGSIYLHHRNLDFSNLDFLEIDGKTSGNTEVQIFYSHCENISTRNAVANFIKFYQCAFGNLNVIDTRLYSIRFYECDIFKAYFENTSISNLLINSSC